MGEQPAASPARPTGRVPLSAGGAAGSPAGAPGASPLPLEPPPFLDSPLHQPAPPLQVCSAPLPPPDRSWPSYSKEEGGRDGRGGGCGRRQRESWAVRMAEK